MTGTAFPIWVQYLQAFSGPFATLTAAIVAAWITYLIQQRHLSVATDKLRLDLYDRRVSYFSETKRIIEKALNSEIPSNEFNNILNEFLILGRKSQFLFGKDVNEFVDSVRDLLTRLEFAHLSRSHKIGSIEMGERAEEVLHTRKSLNEAFRRADDVFLPYLDFRNVKGC